MDHEIDYDFLLCALLQRANERYGKTEEAQLIREKIQRMDGDCETILPPDLRPFVEDCFSLLSETGGPRECYLYRQGMFDTVSILKALRVLA